MRKAWHCFTENSADVTAQLIGRQQLADQFHPILNHTDDCRLILRRLGKTDQHLGAGHAIGKIVDMEVQPFGFRSAVQHVGVELGDELRIVQCAVSAGELRAVDEVLGDAGQTPTVVERLGLEAQAAGIGRTVEGGLVEAVGLAGISASVEGKDLVGKLQSFNVDETVGSAGAGGVLDRNSPFSGADLIGGPLARENDSVDSAAAVDCVFRRR
jgi:hypothetical protein